MYTTVRETARVEYSSNNSGGYWWLDDNDWKKLEAAGWTVEWFKKPFLKANARQVYLDDTTLEDAIDSWTSATGYDPYEEGCPCCSQPHNFYVE